MIRNTWSLGSRRRVLVLGQLGVLEVPNATVHLPVSSVCLVFVCVFCLSCLRLWSAEGGRSGSAEGGQKSKYLLT